jgi:hypothetical protein
MLRSKFKFNTFAHVPLDLQPAPLDLQSCGNSLWFMNRSIVNAAEEI